MGWRGITELLGVLTPVENRGLSVLIYDVVVVSKFQFPSAQKAVHVHLPSLLTLAKQDNHWKVPTLQIWNGRPI